MLNFNCDISFYFINLLKSLEFLEINKKHLSCSYGDALALVASGRVNVKPLITHNFKIEETVKAFDTSKSPNSGAIKVMIHL